MIWIEQRKERQDFINQVAQSAVEDWKDRKICLPSLVIAIAVEGTGWGKSIRGMEEIVLFPHRHDGIRHHKTIRHAVRSHNNYLAIWREDSQEGPNWERLIGQKHYILAVQYLQEAEYPYSSCKSYEAKLIQLIEEYEFYLYDEEKAELLFYNR